MADYTNQATVEAYLKRSLTAYEVTLLSTANPAVKQFIDAFCNRTFDSVAGTKYYDGNGERELFIDDFDAITGVFYIDEEGTELNEEEEGIDYVKYPLNSDYTSRLRSRGRWQRGSKNIKVTGTIGRASVPESIKFVATQLIANLFSNPQNLSSRTIEGYSEVYGKLLDEPNRNLLSANQKIII